MPSKRKPTVVISTYDDVGNPYYGGGGALGVQEVASRLSSRYRITVIAARYPGSTDKVQGGVQYRYIGFSWMGPKIGQFFFSLLLPFIARSMKYDLWVESFTPPFSVSLLPLFSHKPVIGLAHMLSGEDMKRKYKLPFPLIERIGVRLYKWIITPSTVDAVKIRSFSPHTEVIVIPNGVTSPLIENSQDSTEKHISFIGRIEVDQKGLDTLIAAFAKIADKTTFSLQIAGNGDPKEIEMLQKLIKKQKIEQRVKVFGRLEAQEKSRFFARSAIMVLPSRYETFSLVALESLSAGIPLICSDIDGLRWMPEGSSIKVKKSDAASYAKAMLSLLGDKKLRTLLSKRGKEVAKRFSWDASTKLYTSCLEKVLAYV